MKEKEAKTKWCPMFNRSGGYGNSDADGYDRTRCIGSGCMMWRTRLTGFVNMMPNGPDDSLTIVGYCGLAGKP